MRGAEAKMAVQAFLGLACEGGRQREEGKAREWTGDGPAHPLSGAAPAF